MHARIAKPTDQKLLFTIEEAAQILSLGRTLLYERVLRGEIPSVKIGRYRRIPLSALIAFVEKLSVE